MKAVIRKYLLRPSVAKRIVRTALRLHNLSYAIARDISQLAEPDGLHPKHRLMDYHQWFIQQVNPGWHILDVGCGNGALTDELYRHCKNVIGLDISADNIKEARSRSKAEFICADATLYSFKRNFDAIVISNVLEHIKDRRNFLMALHRHSNLFLIRVPMLDRDWVTLYKKELGLEYRLDVTHFVEYTLNSFAKELEDAGLKMESYRVRYGEIYAVAKGKDI